MIPSNESVSRDIVFFKAAEDIAILRSQYGTAVRKLYDEIEEIKYSKQYNGISKVSFITKMEYWKDDFIELELLMEEYETVCIHVANNYIGGSREYKPNIHALLL